MFLRLTGILLYLIYSVFALCDDVIYFSSTIKNEPRSSIVIYNNQVILQSLLNKRYVYSIPQDGEYILDAGRKIIITNGLVASIKITSQEDAQTILYDKGAFFNQSSDLCNIHKFNIAQTLLAKGCQVGFNQYQIIPATQEFVRIIIMPKNYFEKPQTCSPSLHTTQELLDLEGKSEVALTQKHELEMMEQGLKSQGQELKRKERKELEEYKRILQMIMPWESGINARKVILGMMTNKEFKGDLIGFYITYLNDIGCIPYDKMKLASASDFMKYKSALMDNYILLSDKTSDDKDAAVFIASDGININQYSFEQELTWKEEVNKLVLKNAKVGQGY